MVYYVKQGIVPHSRHTYEDREKVRKEELFGEESFDGPYSLIYHVNEPTRVSSVKQEKKQVSAGTDAAMLHRHFRTSEIDYSTDHFRSREVILFNSTLKMGVMKLRGSSSDFFYRNALHDEVLFIHKGSGTLKSMLGDLKFGKNDYVYIPKGTTYKIHHDGDLDTFFVQSRDRIGIPPRYLNVYGQLKEGTPYYERDFRTPVLGKPTLEKGDYTVYVDYSSYFAVEKRDEHPFDVEGWDGYLYPYAINTETMAPIVGKLHQPPPVHETFSGKSFMVGTFLPRKFDFHPRSIPISYYHSNIDTDEVLFYSSGNFMSRKGIEPGSITIHVRGLIHGPQPGSVENAIGKEGTDEIAVMVEAYEPLIPTKKSEEIEDKDYMKSWYA